MDGSATPRLVASLRLARCLVRYLHRNAGAGPKPTAVVRAIASENIWRAQRRGVNASFLDEAGEVASFAAHLNALLAMVEEDAEALGCTAEAARTREIVAEGTSADRQLTAYAEARDGGTTNAAALAAVVDWMATTTASG